MPYDDDYLVYDYDSHNYVITAMAIDVFLGENVAQWYGGADKAQVRINRICRNLYNFIYANIHRASKDYVEWKLANDEVWREAIQEALIAQVEYDMESGASTLGAQHGVDVVKGSAMDLNALRGNVLISASADQALRYAGILYAGLYPYTIASESYRVGY